LQYLSTGLEDLSAWNLTLDLDITDNGESNGTILTSFSSNVSD